MLLEKHDHILASLAKHKFMLDKPLDLLDAQEARKAQRGFRKKSGGDHKQIISRPPGPAVRWWPAGFRCPDHRAHHDPVPQARHHHRPED